METSGEESVDKNDKNVYILIADTNHIMYLRYFNTYKEASAEALHRNQTSRYFIWKVVALHTQGSVPKFPASEIQMYKKLN